VGFGGGEVAIDTMERREREIDKCEKLSVNG